MAIGTKASAVYANPRLVTDLAQCDFYHTIDLPGMGTVEGHWDLRAGLGAYLGNLAFLGKRVLDVGAANGLLSFFMEEQGAEVVSFDLDETGEWDLVPFARWGEREAIAEDRQRILNRLNNAYWFCHRLRNSRARMVYGSVYRIPDEIGPVDVSVYGSILLHLRDPFLALQNGLRLTREAVVVTEFLRGDGPTGPFIGFLPDAATQEPKDTWWDLRPEVVVRMIGVLGFEDVTVTHHQQTYEGRPNAMYTVVGRRR
jgi:SAM-dependent methyltransferase